MNTIAEIFRGLGGTGAVAKALNVGHSTASEMRRRQSIPVKYWPALMECAASAGRSEVDTDLLVRVHVEASQTAGEAA